MIAELTTQSFMTNARFISFSNVFLGIFSVRDPILVRRVFLLAERDVHRDVASGTQTRRSEGRCRWNFGCPRDGPQIHRTRSQKIVFLLLHVGVDTAGYSHNHLDDNGPQSYYSYDLHQAEFRSTEVLVRE